MFLVGPAGPVPLHVREAGGADRVAPMESSRAVGDLQRAAQANPGATLPAAATEDPVDAALRSTAQVANRQRGGF